MPAQKLPLAAAFQPPLVTVYGNLIGDLPFTEKQATEVGLARAKDVTGFALIRAFRIASGICITLPSPRMLVVFGSGSELSSPECNFAPGDVLKWTYSLGEQVLAVEHHRGSVEDILQSVTSCQSHTATSNESCSCDQRRRAGTKGCLDCDVEGKATVSDGKISISLATYKIEFSVPSWVPNGGTVIVRYHGCGCFCTKGGRYDAFYNDQHIAGSELWGDCD